MPLIEESIFIPKPPQDVYDYITAPGSPPEWNTTIVEYHQDEGPQAVGSRSEGTTKFLGRSVHYTTEVIECDPPHRIVHRSVQSPVQFTIAMDFKPQGDGTVFTSRLETETGLGGVFGKLADPLVEKAYARAMHANMLTLVEILTEHRN